MAYLVSDADWARILRTETGYAVEDVTLVRSSDGASIEAATLAYPSLDLGAAGTMPELLPSARYLGIIRAGAEEWSLDEDGGRGSASASARTTTRRTSRRLPNARSAVVASASLAPLARSPRRSGSARPRRRRGARATRRRRRAARAGRSREGGGRRGERGGGRPRRGGVPSVRDGGVGGARDVLGARVWIGRKRRRRRGRTMISSSETERRSGGRRAPGRAGSETTVARGTDSAVGRRVDKWRVDGRRGGLNDS